VTAVETPWQASRTQSSRGRARERPPRLRHGIFLAPFDELADARLVAELAQLAEERWWDGFFLWDHVQYPEAIESIADVWTCLTAVAMRTERVRLGPLVTPLARRRPWVLARQVATLDRLSGGRLVIGFGVGGDGNGEMAPLGEEPDMRVRAEMLEEGLDLLLEMFSGEPVEHEGRHYTINARPFLPRPVQASIPIWLGARWPRVRPIARAARWDGVAPVGIDIGEVAELKRRVAALRPRDSGPFTLVAIVPPGVDHAPWQASGLDWLLTRLGPTPQPGDTPDEMMPLADVRAAIQAGPPAREAQSAENRLD
jgi:alkanesulfonate monooxygenase SsuD/methylene tetrahydromethanopterin reductase-like flavin-dependent oxidoreductase (luciferase family)